MSLWLVGAGRMAEAYAKVLLDLDRPFEVIGRGEVSAAAFAERTGHGCLPGGLDAALTALPVPEKAIVATSVDQLADNCRALIEAGCTDILVEKPGGVTPASVAALAAVAATHGADVRLAYNRRFYASVMKAAEMIAEDGGPQSMHFEFTESVDAVAASSHPAEVKRNWLLANSTHVIDTAFHLAGRPRRLFSNVAGALDWYPRAARFAGTGETERDVLFTYWAEWNGPGRWGIEINTRAHRFVLRPMEQLQVQKRGRFDLEAVALPDTLDQTYKPGLYRQTLAFLDGVGRDRLLSLADHADHVRSIYELMHEGWRQAAFER